MPNLTDDERQAILQYLLRASVNGHLPLGTVQQCADKFNCSRWTVSRVWERSEECQRNGKVCSDVRSRIKGHSGRKGYDKEVLLEKLRALPVQQRRKLRKIALALGVSVGVIQRLLKQGQLRRHTNTLSPLLTPANRIQRLKWALGAVDQALMQFKGLYNVVHLDEKWFYEEVDRCVYYLLPDEEPPQRQRKSKRFIGKTMFLAAVARPRFDCDKDCWFDGKLGIWPFVEDYIAKRKSINHAKGDIYLRNIDSIDRTVYKRFLMTEVIPAIMAKWPTSEKGRTIFLQQDNAKPHVSESDADVRAAGQQGGWDIRVANQPPNSPDFNVLDLGFFRAIQSIQLEKSVTGTESLVEAVVDAYDELDYKKLNNVFLTLQSVLELAMIDCGGNNYKLPHIGKDKLERAGLLPVSLACSQKAFSTAKAFLATNAIV